jgi:hypothetical protein
MTTDVNNAYGSWAEYPYSGSDKYWVIEDNYADVTNNLMDPEKGARVVVRHSTINHGTLASHGMEGGQYMGVKQEEVYNNLFITNQVFGQLRSGTALIYNNVRRGDPPGNATNPSIESQNIYRRTRTEKNWGAVSGDNRYDENAGPSPVFTGTITALSGSDPSHGFVTTLTDNTKDFSSLSFTDGSVYTINDLDDPYTLAATGGTGTDNDPGWQWYHCTITAASGNTLTVNSEGDGGASVHNSAHWAVGHRYEIRKVWTALGQIGQGKGKMLNVGSGGLLGAYDTYFWPATSGTKATWPQEGYPLEPLYMWNNVREDTAAQIGMSNLTNNPQIKKGVDFFELGARLPLETQSVGYPPEDNTQATSNLPGIGPSGTTTYTPLAYPHPLTGSPAGKIILLSGPLNFGNVMIGSSPSKDISIQNIGDATLTVTNITVDNDTYAVDWSSGTIPPGGSQTVNVTFTPDTAQIESGTLTVTSDATSGGNTLAVTGTGTHSKRKNIWRKIKGLLGNLFP